MNRAKDGTTVRSLIAGAVFGSLLLSSCQSMDIVDEGIFSSDQPPTNQQVATQTTVNNLARDIDSLERHIDTYGSVTLKQPDVWGQARLTAIRQEFEQVMKADLTKFTPTLQGTFAASDQAYFMNALAISAAASGTQQVIRPNAAQIVNANNNNQAAPAPTPLPTNPLPTLGDLTTNVGPFGGITRNPVTLPGFLNFGANASIALEPTVIEEQKARYLNALHSLRRINEGDDTADSPGYSLNLIRLPVSILPGKRTDVGYGAELTLTVTPQLSDELLPMTFRNLVLNDLVDQIGFPATQFINNPDNGIYFDPKRATDLDELMRMRDDIASHTVPEQATLARLRALRESLSLEPIFKLPEWQWVDECLRAWDSIKARAARSSKTEDDAYAALKSSIQQTPSAQRTSTPTDADVADWTKAVRSHQVRPRAFQGAIQVPATKSRRARMPFPPTEMPDIYGDEFIFQVASGIFNTFRKEPFAYPCPPSHQMVIHLPDVQGYLQEELAAVQKLLQLPTNCDLWGFCNQDLVNAVRNHAVETIRMQRELFLGQLQQKTQGAIPISPTVSALAWATIVESALLTDQLMHDMKEAAAAKGAAPPGLGPEHWQDYYMPNPSPEARHAFNEYVQIRWPIHVFALNPVQQEQNIGSTFSGSREMQLALSVGFVNGQISANDMMQYARRVEFDAQTIDLNGTTVGFSNGENTFGWRFYPRFQTPEIASNCMAFLQTVFIGGPTRNQLLHQRRLEPGIRECDAVVIMPSFIPYVSVDVSSNWFSLINPKKKDLNAAYAMRLSHQVKSIETCKASVCDGHCYRDGDVSRLYAKVQQLETRLPFQTMSVQVPYENTLGGFGMFNTGVTDLAPELTGWYGTPSINSAGGTDVFLVGNHFSVLQTMIIAGGAQCPPPQLLSRQVLQATIPPGAIQTGANGEQFVDVQLATPYGVTQHLLIPVCESADPAAGSPIGASWKSNTVALAFAFGGLGIVPDSSATDPKTKPPSLLIVPGPIKPDQYDTVMVSVAMPKGMSSGNVTLAPSTFSTALGGYPISSDDLAAQVFAKVGAFYGPTAFPPGKIDAKTTFVFSSSTGSYLPQTVVSGNNLTINWIQATASK